MKREAYILGGREVSMAESRISIFRDGTKVIVWVQPDVDVLKKAGTGYRFEHDFGAEDLASIVADRLNSDVSDTMEAVRREEYNGGWNDKSRKLSKRTYFYSTLARLGDLGNRKR